MSKPTFLCCLLLRLLLVGRGALVTLVVAPLLLYFGGGAVCDAGQCEVPKFEPPRCNCGGVICGPGKICEAGIEGPPQCSDIE